MSIAIAIPLRAISGAPNQFRLDPGVNILRVGLRHWTRRDASLHLIERSCDLLVFLSRENPGLRQRDGVSALQFQLMRDQKPIVLETPIQRCKRRVEFPLRLPQCLHHSPP